MVVYVSLFGPRNALIGNGGIAIKIDGVDACFGPRSPLTGFGGTVVKLEEALVNLL